MSGRCVSVQNYTHGKAQPSYVASQPPAGFPADVVTAAVAVTVVAGAVLAAVGVFEVVDVTFIRMFRIVCMVLISQKHFSLDVSDGLHGLEISESIFYECLRCFAWF